jgi:hypothetical protein
MTHPPYLREKARELRTKNKLSLDEIAERLALGKTTVWYWIRDLPDPAIKHRDTRGRRRVREDTARRNRTQSKALRDAAYRQGVQEFDRLDREPGFRDFVCMYIGEGYKRCRNTVSVANSDPRVIELCDYWIRRFSGNQVRYSFQYHADQDPNELIKFWSDLLDAPRSAFSYQRKSNSGQLNGRQWRSVHGVLSIRACDTQFRARLQAWIDQVKEGWLHSPDGV